MEQAQFESAIQQLFQRFQTCKQSEKLQRCDWQDVNLIKANNLPSGSGHFLRITRLQHTKSTEQAQERPETNPSTDSGDVQYSDDEVDSESLPKFPTTTPSVATVATEVSTITYDIIYSPTYCVPVLYIHKQGLPPTFLASVPGAALSLVDHPITLKPVYFVHPCRTQEAVREVMGDRPSTGEGLPWLMVWFGVIGASAGLQVPLEVAKEL